MNETEGLLSLVIFIMKNNKTIIFIGDSMSEHSFRNLRLGLIRIASSNKYSSSKHNKISISNEFEKDKMDLIKKNKVLNIIKDTKNLQYRGFDLTIVDVDGFSYKSTFYSYRYNVYKGRQHFESHFQNLLNVTNDFFNGSIIIANIGLWVNYRHEGLIYFEKMLQYLDTTIQNVGPLN